MRRPIGIKVNNNRIPAHLRKCRFTRGGSIYLQGSSIYLQGPLRGRSIGSFFKGLWNKLRSFVVPNAKRLIKEHGPSLISAATKKLAENVPAITDAALDKLGIKDKQTRKTLKQGVGKTTSFAKSAVDKNVSKFVRDQVGSGLRIES